ncbi:H/ACA ribonucleoprotein complex subunit GAR1 [Methanobacterium alcaliphilum]|uniref:H/ACA ribonucleoprotein complex subunit GAR1 n=1 Tax=Methanobacterium alcaliphilum TaxID=392018 RepID=UPI00200A876A|nr:Gar1/Naf1 family protein [Methanobacterium alcaliphilum]MCK9150949.1 Gar1/Naf1 family protein [Methanobacterium alcaliphilum]
MKILGTISHISNKGNIIARSSQSPALGLPVFTKDNKRIGKVHDVFGPTKKPYVTIKPFRTKNSDVFHDQVGEELYVSTKPVKKWGRKKRKKR